MSFSARSQANTFRRTNEKWGKLDYRQPLYTDDVLSGKTSATSIKGILANVPRPSGSSTSLSARSACSRSMSRNSSTTDAATDARTDASKPTEVSVQTQASTPTEATKPGSPREKTVRDPLFVVEGTARLRKELQVARTELAEKDAEHTVSLHKWKTRAEELDEELRVLKEKSAVDESYLREKVSQLASDLVAVEGALHKEKKEHSEAERLLSSLRVAESRLQESNAAHVEEHTLLLEKVIELENAATRSRAESEVATKKADEVQALAEEESKAWKTRCAKLAAHLEWRGKAVTEDCSDLIEELEEYRREQTPSLIAHLAGGAQASTASRTEASAWESAYKAASCEVEDLKRRARETAAHAEEHNRTLDARVRAAEERAMVAEKATRAAEQRLAKVEHELRMAKMEAKRAVQELPKPEIPRFEPRGRNAPSAMFASASVDTIASVDAFNLQSSYM